MRLRPSTPCSRREFNPTCLSRSRTGGSHRSIRSPAGTSTWYPASASRALPTATRTHFTVRCGAHPDRARIVLDLARADVRRGIGAHAGHLLRACPRHVCRDARDRHHRGRRVPLPASPARRDAVLSTPTRWAERSWRRPTTQGSGSACSTPATSRRASANHPREFRCASPTVMLTRGRNEWLPSTTLEWRCDHRSAVPRDQLKVVVEAAQGGPLHVHVSEQVAENEACLAAYGVTPTQLLADAGALGPQTTAVHATHLSSDDIGLLGSRTPTSVSARRPNATSPTGSVRRGCCTTQAPP